MARSSLPRMDSLVNFIEDGKCRLHVYEANGCLLKKLLGAQIFSQYRVEMQQGKDEITLCSV